jgi:hypothetical protein
VQKEKATTTLVCDGKTTNVILYYFYADVNEVKELRNKLATANAKAVMWEKHYKELLDFIQKGA